MNSRFARRQTIGDSFTMTTPSCPPGSHWQDDAAGPIRGISACVPDRKVLIPLHLALPAAAPAPSVTVTTSPAPDAAPAPSLDMAPPATAATCPPTWSWWWLVVAGAAGAVAGAYAAKKPKKVRRNVARVANFVGARAVHRVSNAAINRIL